MCVSVFLCVTEWVNVCGAVILQERQVQEEHKHTARGQRLQHSIKHCEGNYGQLDLPFGKECGKYEDVTTNGQSKVFE